jgi:superfamily I DNA and/or RNA helicase
VTKSVGDFISDDLDPGLKTLLKTQYRMNSQIMNLSSGYIYGGELLAAESCANHSLDGYSTSGSET